MSVCNHSKLHWWLYMRIYAEINKLHGDSIIRNHNFHHCFCIMNHVIHIALWVTGIDSAIKESRNNYASFQWNSELRTPQLWVLVILERVSHIFNSLLFQRKFFAFCSFNFHHPSSFLVCIRKVTGFDMNSYGINQTQPYFSVVIMVSFTDLLVFTWKK